MRMVSHAPTRAPRVWLTAVVCVLLACLAWSAPALASAPTVEEAFVTDVASTSATLQAHVNPGGEETTYRFEYGTTEAYGSSAPVPDGLAGSEESVTSVEAHVQGLAAHTTYHYRVVARNALGTVDGEDLTFTTQAAGGELVLPDDRQWEMVSPVDKYGALLEPLQEQAGLDVAAANGDAMTYVSRVPLESGPQGYAYTAQSISALEPAGWQSRGIAVPHAKSAGKAAGLGPEYRFFSSDLSHAIVQPTGAFTPCRSAEGAEQPCLSPEASEQTAFLTTNFLNGNIAEPCLPRTMSCARPLASGCPEAGDPCAPVLAEHADVPAGTVFGGLGGGDEDLTTLCTEGGSDCGPLFEAASPDLSHVLIRAAAGLTPGSHGGLYEWAAGQLAYVGNGNVAGRLASSGHREPGIRPVSDNGSRVVFVEYTTEHVPRLLLHDSTTGETIDLNAGLVGDPSFQAASASGSRVFFTDSGELYVYEVREGGGPLGGSLRELAGGAGIEGSVLGVSEDGSYVYFVSQGVLPGSGAVRSGDNLYVDRLEGSVWKATFIAALSAEDSHDWLGEEGTLHNQSARISPNGEWLALMSQTSLTGYDNRDALTGKPDAEVYLYDAGANRLVCASCDPTGARPTGVEGKKLIESEGGLQGADDWSPENWVAASVPGWQETTIDGSVELYQSRYLSDGGRLFFDSEGALVPQDVNGTEDVYEYEPSGAGNCDTSLTTYSARAAGCIALISSGISPEESVFLDASESGGGVFFLSSAKLVPQDVETSLSLYDARECSADAPCIAAPVSPPPCETEASCRPAPSPQPAVFGAPASATLTGGGNVATSTSQPAPVKSATGRKAPKKACARGERRKRGRCTKAKVGHAKKARNVKVNRRGR